MEDTARLIVIFLFIGLVVMGVVFLGITLLSSLGNGQFLGGHRPTSTIVYGGSGPSGSSTQSSSAYSDQSGLPFESRSTSTKGLNPVVGGSSSLPTVEGGTRHTITESIPTPGSNATNTPANVAIPTAVQQTGAIASRDFIITGTGGRFSPSTIVVNEGDVVNIALVAADGPYNIFFPDFGVSITAQKGGTARAQFQPSGYGQYKFYCKDICSGQPTGTLIVNQ